MSYIWLPYMIIPIYAGLERIPDTLLSASEDMGAKPGTTFRRVILPLVFPAVVAGSIFTFSLTLGDFITPGLVGSGEQFIGTVVATTSPSTCRSPPPSRPCPIVIMIIYLLIARRLGAFEHLYETLGDIAAAAAARRPGSRSRSSTCRCWSWSSTRSARRATFEWPPPGFTARVVRARRSTTPAPATPSCYSVKTGLLATAVALVLGTLASLAVARHQFFGRETISFLVILPIALPGIVTGIALNSTFTQVFGHRPRACSRS